MTQSEYISTSLRESKFELLRIVAMLLIVAGHFYEQTLDYHQHGDSIILFISSASRISVNLFLFIGVWFMVGRKFNFKRVFKIWNCVFFWCVGLTLFYLIVGGRMPIMELGMNFLPILYYRLWFASAYIVLIIISPLLEIVCQTLYERLGGGKIKSLLVILGILVIGEATYRPGVMDTWYCAMVYFAFVYIVIWFFKKGVVKLQFGRLKMLLVSLTIYATLVFFANYEGSWAHQLKIMSVQYLYDYKSLPNVIIAICVFLLFISLKLGHNRAVNAVASVSFGVYVISQVPGFRDYLWKDIILIEKWGYSHNFDLYFVVAVILIYTFCGFMDYIRRSLVESRFVETNIAKRIIGYMNDIYGDVMLASDRGD